MNLRPDNFDDLTRLISGLLDDQLAENDRLRLEVRLETDVTARRVYLQMIDQEIELACLTAPVDSEKLLSLGTVPESAAPERARRRRNIGWWLAAAAAVALMVALWPVLTPRGAPRPVADIGSAIALSWKEDFETGDAPGWIGELVAADLPAGSKYGVRAVRTQRSYGVYYEVALPADWDDGLFALTNHSTLHITYRVGQPAASLNVFMHTAPSGPTRGQFAMFRMSGSRFPGLVGQWQTASIPFSFFERKVIDASSGQLDFTGGPPQVGEIVTAILFSAPDELDLVIDQMWITPTGSGQDEIRPLQDSTTNNK